MSVAPARRSRGFTLLELLIVIGILMLLISILMPTVSRARFQSQRLVCTANLHQWTAAAAHYASEHRGYLPRHDTISTGGDLWDVDPGFVRMMTGAYSFPRQALACPLVDANSRDDNFNAYTEFRIIGYMVWIPRLNGNHMLPPLKPGDFAGERYTYPNPTSPVPFVGPDKFGDSAAVSRPIFTDVVGSPLIDDPLPANARPDAPGDPYHIVYNHLWNGHFEPINQAYADGHVEAVYADAIRPRFACLYWNWR